MTAALMIKGRKGAHRKVPAPSVEVVLLGSGGNSQEIYVALDQINEALGRERYRCVGVLDDNPKLHGKRFFRTRIAGPLASAQRFSKALFVNGIGNTNTFVHRAGIVRSLKLPPARWATLVHPSASIATTARIGSGSVILQNVVVGPDVRIGEHVLILPNTIISHGSSVGDFTCMAGGVCLAGDVHVGPSTYIGANVSVRGGVDIGGHSLIGMGAVILKPVDSNSVWVGNPARFLRRLTPGRTASLSAAAGSRP